MKKYFLYFTVLLIISCNTNKTNEITIGIDDKFQLSDGEKNNENFSKDIFNLFDTLVNVNSEYQSPLHKVITAKDYIVYIAIPVGIDDKDKLTEAFFRDTSNTFSVNKNEKNTYSVMKYKASFFIFNSLVMNDNHSKSYLISAISNDSSKIVNLFKQNYAKNKIIYND